MPTARFSCDRSISPTWMSPILGSANAGLPTSRPEAAVSRSTFFFRLCMLSTVTLVTQHRLAAQSTERYQYAVPASLNDGIRTGTLMAAGLDAATIVAGTQQILTNAYPGIRSLLILRHNTLVYENYFASAGAEQDSAVPSRDHATGSSERDEDGGGHRGVDCARPRRHHDVSTSRSSSTSLNTPRMRSTGRRISPFGIC